MSAISYPWKPLEIAINQRCFTYLGILLSPVLREDLWRIQENSAPATAADPVACASTRLCKLSYYPSQPETTHSSTLYPTISLYHGFINSSLYHHYSASASSINLFMFVLPICVPLPLSPQCFNVTMRIDY